MTKKTRTTIYVSLCLLFIIYMISANYFYYVIIKTDQEARIARIDLPEETQNIKFAFDQIKKEHIKWKEALYFRGWAFNDLNQLKDKDIYFVLQSKSRIFIYKIENENINRPDVTRGFNLKENIHNHGFEFYIPIYRLNQGLYKTGIIIKDDTGMHFSSVSRRGKVNIIITNKQLFYVYDEFLNDIKH